MIGSKELSKKNKVGLVLSGGGAKGAYQVGVMQAIQEMNIPIDMISGASIGALNGAVLASAPNLNIGITRLQELWKILPTVEPVKFELNTSNHSIVSKIPSPTLKKLIYFSLLVSLGLRFSSPIGVVSSLLGKHILSTNKVESIFSDKALQAMLEKFLDLEMLQGSIPLYVSVFQQSPEKGALSDFSSALGDGIRTGLLGMDNSYSTFKHIQALGLSDQKDMILASAALPLLFKAFRDASGRRFTDGGQGGLIKSQGNTPITPLIEAGCSHIIVTHLSEGSLWHRHDFPNVQVIEIRPSIEMGGFSAMLDFSEEAVKKLIRIGYEDAINSLIRVKVSLDSIHSLRHSSNQLINRLSDRSSSDNLESSMNKLRGFK